MELDHLPTIQYFNTRIWQLPRPLITTERLQLFYLLNEDFSTQFKPGPLTLNNYSGKTLQETMTLKLLLFLIVNGCSPQVIAKCILTSPHWPMHNKGIKRARQIDFIFQNLTRIWFYFDIHHNQWLLSQWRKKKFHQSLITFSFVLHSTIPQSSSTILNFCVTLCDYNYFTPNKKL